MFPHAKLMKILITGCNGFVGTAIAESAIERGWNVHGVGRSHVDLVALINDYCPDMIFHAAGCASVGRSFDEPLEDLHANVLTFAVLLDAVRKSACRPVILFPSSAAVYGNPIQLPISIKNTPNPISPYGFHKLQSEFLAREYAQLFGLTIGVFRLFSLLGPRQKRLLAWELFQQFTGSQSFVQLKGTGEETRDFLYVGDAAKMMLNLAENHKEGVAFFNIASGCETSVLELATMMGRLLGQEKVIRKGSAVRRGDPVRWRGERDARWQGQLLSVNDALRICVEAWS